MRFLATLLLVLALATPAFAQATATPTSTQRTVVHAMTLSSTAAATVAIRIGAATFTVNVAAGVPYSLPAPIYGDKGSTVVLTRTTGTADVNAILWTTTDER